MTYEFVKSATDLGLRSGPILGVNCHMAEGGGTVGFLSRPNRDGVSVHYVVEYSGRVVQMLLESHMQTAIRIHEPDGSYAIRQDDEANGYGHTAAVAVLGAWADTHTTGGPNNATIGIECEGFASAGPNPAQTAALVAVVADIRSRHPGVGLTGHRDHNVKACPGLHFPWAELGGHGAATGGIDEMGEFIVPLAPVPFAIANDARSFAADPPHAELSTLVGTVQIDATVFISSTDVPHGAFVRVITGTTGRRLIAAASGAIATPPAPPPDPAVIAAAVNAALDHVSPAVDGVDKAIAEARPRQ